MQLFGVTTSPWEGELGMYTSQLFIQTQTPILHIHIHMQTPTETHTLLPIHTCILLLQFLHL